MSLLSKCAHFAGRISSISPENDFSHMFQLHSTAPLFYFVHWQQ